MPILQQLSVFLENKLGMLARTCSILSDNGVNILALSINDHSDQAVVRLIVDNPTKALLLIENEGFYVLDQEVVIKQIDNFPGVLADISRRLAKADISIHYAYCTAMDGQDRSCLVIKTDSPERADSILSELS